METTGNLRQVRYPRLIGINALILSLILVISEGLASYVLLAREITRPAPSVGPPSDSLHTEYQADLGWANKPNAYVLDLYGPGAYMKTNSQGLRSNYDFTRAAAKGRIRIVCSGDSVTLGYGVSNDHTWCQRLTMRDARLETLNMGQSGYGVDQAYLRYKRDASSFEHHIHLMAFIVDDIFRMQSDTMLGYGKPVLAIEDDRLVVRNVPVPKRTAHLSRLAVIVREVRRLRTLELVDRALWKVGFKPASATASAETASNQKAQEVLRKVFEDLKRLNEERSSQLVLVLLPTLYDLTQSQRWREWADFLEEESRTLGLPMINLLDGFGRLRHKDILDMFFAHGHLTERGNEFAARLIYEELKKHPLTKRTLSTDRGN